MSGYALSSGAPGAHFTGGSTAGWLRWRRVRARPRRRPERLVAGVGLGTGHAGGRGLMGRDRSSKARF